MLTLRTAAVLLSLAVVSTQQSTFGQASPPAAPATATVPAATSANENITRGKVDAVTVYRGQALVTRNVPLPAGAGLAEIVVSELPDHMLSSSLFAEGSDGVEVRSVRYRERPVARDVREEVRKIDDQLRDLSDKVSLNTKQLQVLSEQRAYLDKLETFVAPTATTELTKGVLNAEQLKTLTNFQFETRKSIADQELKIQLDQRSLQEQIQLLSRERGEIAQHSSRTLREAVVFISRAQAGGTLRLRYLVDAATWSPSYSIRASADKASATLDYQASIAQLSGEDWTDVSMTLSTASPNLVAAAPMLNPLHIAMAAPAPLGGAAGGRGGFGGGGGGGGGISVDVTVFDNSVVQRNLSSLRQNAENIRSQSNGGNVYEADAEKQREEQRKNDDALNRLADRGQVLELLTRDSGKGEDRRIDPTEGIVVSYALRTRTTLPSRSDRQLIQIDHLPLQSKFYKVAIPVLTSYVYDQADLTNNSSIVLLAGPVASYVGGQFVGSGTINTVAVGQPFTVGFGIDSSLRATRDRIEKTEQTQGGNRIVNFTYRLSVENFGTKPADVRLMDRLPVGTDGEVRVNFDEAENVKLSSDKEYQSTERKKGILRWDVTVPAQKNGSEAFSLTYKLHLEHDRNLAISTTGLLGPELNELLRN